MRASHQQIVTLVELMERYGDLGRPQQGPRGRVRADRLWDEVEGTLNAISGGVSKSVEKWKKVWADYKTKTKKKALQIRRESTRTGGGPSSSLALSALQKRVLAVVGLSAVDGIQNIKEDGSGNQTCTMRASHRQYATLVELMEKYGDLGRHQQGPQGRLRADRLWQEVGGTLNAISGGMYKSVAKWKKVWADYKTKTKRKALQFRRESTRTGKGPSSKHALSDLEERVLAILGLSAMKGLQTIEEDGFGIRKCSESSHGDDSEEDIKPTAFLHSGQADESPSYAEPPPALDIPPPSPAAERTPPNGIRMTVCNCASEFAAIEDRRLKYEQEKERNFHEREKERQKIDVERNQLFARLADILDKLVDKLP